MTYSENIARFSNPAKCRAILIEFLSQQMPGLWIPLVDVRAGTRWPDDNCQGVRIQRLVPAVKSAAADGVIEFKSGQVEGRASVRLRVQSVPESPAQENT